MVNNEQSVEGVSYRRSKPLCEVIVAAVVVVTAVPIALTVSAAAGARPLSCRGGGSRLVQSVYRGRMFPPACGAVSDTTEAAATTRRSLLRSTFIGHRFFPRSQ